MNDRYVAYVTMCALHGIRPLSFTAWSAMFPLPHVEY